MDAQQRLRTVSSHMHLEPDSEQEGPQRYPAKGAWHANGAGAHNEECRPVVNGKEWGTIPISELQLPGGRRLKVLKTMLTSACERNCYYCPFRAGRDMRRATLKPEEMAKAFMQLYTARAVEGLFLSSGIIKGGVTTQDKLIDAADILRNRHRYRGYLHLKLMPGVEKDQVRRSMQLADRVSTNLEAPNTSRLRALAPMKQYTEELLQPLKWAQEIRRNESPTTTWNGRWASSITQFVIGAVGESDLELLSTTFKLYDQAKLKRVYYSSFNPIQGTPFENLPPENPQRQQRLYEASFLMRDYNYALEEMPFNPGGGLPLDVDPKTAWARENLTDPVEINRAGRQQLLRIPGIGPKGAAAILATRRRGQLRSLTDLKRAGVRNLQRSAPFILLDGKRPDFATQLALF